MDATLNGASVVPAPGRFRNETCLSAPNQSSYTCGARVAMNGRLRYFSA